eukprot:399308_1
MNDTPPSSPEIHSKNKTLESLQQIKNNFAASIDQKTTPITSPIENNTQNTVNPSIANLSYNEPPIVNQTYSEPPTSISPKQDANNLPIMDMNDNNNNNNNNDIEPPIVNPSY